MVRLGRGTGLQKARSCTPHPEVGRVVQFELGLLSPSSIPPLLFIKRHNHVHFDPWFLPHRRTANLRFKSRETEIWILRLGAGSAGPPELPGSVYVLSLWLPVACSSAPALGPPT